VTLLSREWRPSRQCRLVESKRDMNEHHRGRVKASPLASWPLWKAIGMCLGGPVFLAGILWSSSLMVPPVQPERETGIFMLVVTLGVASFLWSWKSFSWASRVAVTALVAMVFLAVGIRAWTAILGGIWLWVVVFMFASLFCLAWLLPAVSPAVSASMWNEVTTPQTPVGRGVMKWTLRLGLGGAGVLGASLGMSLMRTGGAPLAYLIVALGMSILAVLLAQSFSHQIWPESPWAKRVSSLPKNEGT
jgi:hypothetical protein